MYYYLDKDDGYSKGPYTWEELKRLPLLPDTYIYNQQRVEWRTLDAYHAQMATEARTAVKRTTTTRIPERQPADVSTAVPDIWRDRKSAPPRPAPKPKPVAAPAPRMQYETKLPSAGPENEHRRQFPPVIYQPSDYDDSPMGLSGTTIFVIALVLAVLLILFFVLLQ